jgi:hypothetical protein
MTRAVAAAAMLLADAQARDEAVVESAPTPFPRPPRHFKPLDRLGQVPQEGARQCPACHTRRRRVRVAVEGTKRKQWRCGCGPAPHDMAPRRSSDAP